ncbi:aminotransferase class I/II-fold pyridoxal phosphate-dependent enzyme [Sphingobacterium sp. SRCM116780]|uniref:trans-sulfuration enzyme family protein n=1 Tax=Sphingobacterium sp. SRCM116780 TaxID=2907623 RepID=UPI001F232329|nr:aminotransferase class I/II-fold pyridoxal phosphate-dependent enzyme [Sphingobacterium sp. SRCM116780]UIR54652.1 aminotransferase class I/II-fold pyridoxal phosphate-dependent enzyme [Sphingobacterium sp. SRCM116780]
MNKNKIDFGTLAIHQEHSDGKHAHIAPIYASSTFTFDSAEQGMRRFAGEEKGYIYSRFGNPTTDATADAIADLETWNIVNPDGTPLRAQALLTSSGQSAMATLFLSCLSAGDAILATSSLYGGTHEFISKLLPRFGIKVYFLSMTDMNQVEDLLKANPEIKLVHFESPANPTMQCIDMEQLVQMSKKYNKLVSVDNTFATPYLQQPFKYGVDFVFHSTTKFLNGHGNAIGGVLIGRDHQAMNTHIHQTHKLLGVNSNPFDAFLVLQGIKTLPLRMEQHCQNAIQVANFLNEHQEVLQVHYNGLPSHPDYAISNKQMRHAGSVMSIELKGGYQKSIDLINKLQICTRAVSIGTVDTLVSHPASMSHAGVPRAIRLQTGITDGLIRISVGLESIQDIISDFEQALR